MTPLFAHAIAVLLLTGVIWTIQLINYPGFPDIEKRAWPPYHKRHSQRITIIVLPLMLTELGTSGWLLWNEITPFHIAFFALALFNWIVTGVVFMPLHQRIVFRPTESSLQRLTQLNWMRTFAWTTASILSVISIM